MKNTLKFTKYLLIFILTLTGLNAFGQHKNSKKGQFGIFASQELAMVSIDGPNQLDLIQTPSYGASVGLKYERRLNEYLLFETGVLYGYRSYRIDNFIIGTFDPLSSFVEFSTIEDNFSFHRVALPVYLKYKLTSKWMFSAGIDLDLYLNKDRRRSASNSGAAFSEDLLTTDMGINTFPVGVTFGFNRKFFGKKLNTEAYLLFNYNFNEIEIPVDEKSNRQVNIGVGFVFWL